MVSRRMSLAFDYNVALKGVIAEKRELDKAKKPQGQIGSRSEAQAAMAQARAELFEMEQQRKKRA